MQNVDDIDIQWSIQKQHSALILHYLYESYEKYVTYLHVVYNNPFGNTFE